ncbi:hypothetical protein BDQ17DRAFT_1284567 [Cyathus striatus]|nr:hypothetical protein BDQ17DRAFT_1284567 [Cyathus striatus]
MAFAGVNNFKIIVGGDFNQREINYHENSAKAMDTITCAACPGAGHDSAERADPPKCHPDTRKRVIEEIMKWVNMPDSENRIMWLNGAAGIGKSAIAQTIAEALKNTLISSFFFSRTSTSTGRDDGTRVIPTIVYHLAIRMPQARSLILEEVMRDPAIFQHSMEEQLKSLVTDPIMHLKMNGDLLTPCLVIIDGLDECNSNDVQSRIIKAIADIAVLQPLQLRFLIASRPECEIQKTFDLPLVNNISTRLTLDQKYHPDLDIETYLLDAFNTIKQTHALAYELSGTPRWPTWYDLWRLVDKSSGQFIYASIVVKFISDDNHDTREALGVIIDETLKHTLEENPFAQLDALYNHILSSAVFKTKGGYDAIMAILKVIALTKATQIDMKYLAAFLGVKESDMKLQMLHLHSIIYIPTKADHFYSIRFHHASVRDFLLDPSRSGKFSLIL